MRASLRLPQIDKQNLNEVRELMQYLIIMLKEYSVKAPNANQLSFQDLSVAVEYQGKLARLNQLTGKVNDPLSLAADLQENELDDIAMLALLPSPPALSDITAEEVAEILEQLKQPQIKKYEAAYYIELLEQNLLLPEAQTQIAHSENKHLVSDLVTQAVAKKLNV